MVQIHSTCVLHHPCTTKSLVHTQPPSHVASPLSSTSPHPLYPQDRMHLDCVFSILGDNVCLMLDEMMGEESPTRRLVDEYVRLGPGTPYKLERQGVEFSKYMHGLGWHIIPIKAADQLVCTRGWVVLGGW